MVCLFTNFGATSFSFVQIADIKWISKLATCYNMHFPLQSTATPNKTKLRSKLIRCPVMEWRHPPWFFGLWTTAVSKSTSLTQGYPFGHLSHWNCWVSAVIQCPPLFKHYLFLAHLRHRLKWDFLIKICPLSAIGIVVVVINFSHFHHLQFQPNLAPSIPGPKKFKFVNMNPYTKGDN